VLHAMETDERSEDAASTRPAIDLNNDPACVSLKAILKSGPKLLGAIEKDHRSPSRRRVSKLLKLMAGADMVGQTKSRGPWRLLNKPAAK